MLQHWRDGTGDTTKLIVVTDEALYAQSLPVAMAQRQVEELAAGKSPATVFGADATHVVLRSVSRVQCSSSDEDIDFTSREGKDEKTVSLEVEDKAIRDEVFAAVEQATQGRFQYYEDQFGRARAAFGSLLALTVFGVGTRVLASAAAAVQAAGEYEAEGRKKGLKQAIVWLLDLLGPTGVTIIGSLICALIVWHLVTRIKAPPHLQILQARPYTPQGSIVTAIKYIGLAAVWVWLLSLLLR